MNALRRIAHVLVDGGFDRWSEAEIIDLWAGKEAPKPAGHVTIHISVTGVNEARQAIDQIAQEVRRGAA